MVKGSADTQECSELGCSGSWKVPLQFKVAIVSLAGSWHIFMLTFTNPSASVSCITVVCFWKTALAHHTISVFCFRRNSAVKHHAKTPPGVVWQEKDPDVVGVVYPALNNHCYTKSDPCPGNRTVQAVKRWRSGLDQSTAPMRDCGQCWEVLRSDSNCTWLLKCAL